MVKETAKGTVRSRLIYRTLTYNGRRGEQQGFREPQLIALLDAAHQAAGHGWSRRGRQAAVPRTTPLRPACAATAACTRGAHTGA